MSQWDFENSKEMLSLLVGADYGSNPESKLDDIRKDKNKIAEFLATQNKLHSELRVLELGTGCGHIARWIAPQVGHLFCADISESFLKMAQQECQSLKNLSYHLIDSGDLDFLEPASIDLVYAYNVFIHFNLFDIYWYFKEFKRVIKPNGRVWFDFANTENFRGRLPELFLEMADHYKKNQNKVSNLVQWCAPQAVIDIASHWGFQLSKKYDHNYIFTNGKD